MIVIKLLNDWLLIPSIIQDYSIWVGKSPSMRKWSRWVRDSMDIFQCLMVWICLICMCRVWYSPKVSKACKMMKNVFFRNNQGRWNWGVLEGCNSPNFGASPTYINIILPHMFHKYIPPLNKLRSYVPGNNGCFTDLVHTVFLCIIPKGLFDIKMCKWRVY